MRQQILQSLRTERFNLTSYEVLVRGGKLNLGVFWLKNDSSGDVGNSVKVRVLTTEILENFEVTLLEFTWGC